MIYQGIHRFKTGDHERTADRFVFGDSVVVRKFTHTT